jgi:dTDP-4-amino-4,6-dideoxygalactose transaminase
VTGLAVLGGTPAFAPNGLPFVQPSVPPLDDVMRRLRPSYDAGRLTNGRLVADLERVTAKRLGVQHVVAVASCTAGLMLALRALRPEGSVLLPSFTFSASAHAVAWNGLDIEFAECRPESFQLDTADAARRLQGAGTVLATHVFGAPCRPFELEKLTEHAGIPLVFDAAHAFGATSSGRPVGGFGSVEVFSMTPTKPLVAGEGGLVATDLEDVAEIVRIGRDYGNPGDYDTRFVGLNARMSELHAAVALESLERFDEHLVVRRALAERYTAGLAAIPGLRVQQVDNGDHSTWKDFTIAVDDEYGVSRDALRSALVAEGVDTRCYFDPPVHRQRAYAASVTPALPVTDDTARRVLSLPIYPGLGLETIDTILELLSAVPREAPRLQAAVRR